jgi:hypothetical protein
MSGWPPRHQRSFIACSDGKVHKTRVLCTPHEVGSLPEHISDEGDDMEAGKGCCIALVVSDQPTTERVAHANNRSTNRVRRLGKQPTIVPHVN